jgi:hypothetical protein
MTSPVPTAHDAQPEPKRPARVKVLLHPPIDCVYCGSRQFYPSRAKGSVVWFMSRFLHYYHCHHCTRGFLCVSRSRMHWDLRRTAVVTFTAVFLGMVAALGWLLVGLLRV